MKKTAIPTLALLLSLAGTALAQAPATPAAPAAAPAATQDPIVQMRMEKKAADEAYEKGMSALKAERQVKIDAAVDAAVKEANAKGADPLVAKREATGKVKKATQKDFDAKQKELKKVKKAAYEAADKKAKGAK
jgi:hypothetical protein